MRKKILAVDDNPANNEIIQEILEDDYELRIATSGEEALQILENFQPDLILLDVMMPGMSGYETCRKIRTISSLSETTIIMLSAKDRLDDKVEGYNAGSCDYITKPFNEKDLLQSIEWFLRRDIMA